MPIERPQKPPESDSIVDGPYTVLYRPDDSKRPWKVVFEGRYVITSTTEEYARETVNALNRMWK